ncbi:MAG TPA: thioesterase family protein [Anaerolineales bacterium]|nr:thioesterase family protein [Anaerolineales bacterium]
MRAGSRPLQTELIFPVRTYDIDFAGLLSNIVYIRWLEDLRVRMLEVHHPLEPMLARGEGPVLARTEIDYLRPVRFGARVRGVMWISGCRRARFDLEAVFDLDDEPVARARQQGYFVNYGKMKILPVPQELLSKIRGQTM